MRLIRGSLDYYWGPDSEGWRSQFDQKICRRARSRWTCGPARSAKWASPVEWGSIAWR
ncbi:hypothetical protein MJ575_21810 [Klebsiella pneumoniae]|nr:hypothetical protein MJ575_21810 [Klebsiella pneumoniae]